MKEEYAAAPDRFLADRGYGELDGDDIREAVSHLADAEPPGVALHLDPAEGLGSIAEIDVATIDDPFAEPAESADPWLDDFDPDVRVRPSGHRRRACRKRRCRPHGRRGRRIRP